MNGEDDTPQGEAFADPTWGLPADVDSSDWSRVADIEPRRYLCHYTERPPRIDGRLDDRAWRDDVWSDLFVDIEGDVRPAPHLDTRMAMRWDDEHLYIAARLGEPHVWGHITETDSVIYLDNDFEVFIDPDGDHHHYYEVEVNALNTTWQLALEKPYRDGGKVISPAHIEGLRTAVHVHGTLNAPHDVDLGWFVEMAIPFEGLTRYGGPRPEEGATWRMNFSRVEWEHEVSGGAYRKIPDRPERNWVWTPQGLIDMHRPERWGYVQFTRDEPGRASFVADPSVEAREALTALYYAQRSFRQVHGRWADSLDELDDDVDPRIRLEKDSSGDGGWTAAIDSAEIGRALQIDHESRLTKLP